MIRPSTFLAKVYALTLAVGLAVGIPVLAAVALGVWFALALLAPTAAVAILSYGVGFVHGRVVGRRGIEDVHYRKDTAIETALDIAFTDPDIVLVPPERPNPFHPYDWEGEH